MKILSCIIWSFGVPRPSYPFTILVPRGVDPEEALKKKAKELLSDPAVDFGKMDVKVPSRIASDHKWIKYAIRCHGESGECFVLARSEQLHQL